MSSDPSGHIKEHPLRDTHELPDPAAPTGPVDDDRCDCFRVEAAAAGPNRSAAG